MGWSWVAGSTWDYFSVEMDGPKQEFLSPRFSVMFRKKTFKICGRAVLIEGT